MNEFENLELSTETLRELSRDEMAQVAGGTVGPISRTCIIISPTVVYIATIVVDEVTQQASLGCA